MNFNEIKELIGIVNDSELKYFQLNTGDVNISMSKSDNIQLGENKQISSAPIQYEETVKTVQAKEESEPVSETKTEKKDYFRSSIWLRDSWATTSNRKLTKVQKQSFRTRITSG